MSNSDAYSSRVQSQIDQYVNEGISDLPDIFFCFSHYFLRPAMLEVFSVESVNDFYINAAIEVSDRFSKPCRILSVGCGDGVIEMSLAASILEKYGGNFTFECVDLSPVLIERFQESVVVQGLEKHVIPRVDDLNKAAPVECYDVIMANQSLHHIMELEHIFDFIFKSLNNNGIFVTSDMIGRNGHMRWTEASAFLQVVWPLLSEKQRYHHQLQRFDEQRFEDHDCSEFGFEGIRAQDVLSEVLKKFHPYKFIGTGGFIDVLIDRGYGPGFDLENTWDREFITAMCRLNEIMLDADVIKPTMMMAYFTKNVREEIFYRGRSAGRSIRNPDQVPDWTKWHKF
jgi:2-polyprenyl-3-methyl-5-hydroxy-6-metoxy-1,4-benzoquinol methylase